MREVRWERMFPDELERAVAERPVVYFAYGLCEPHGPHNAVGLDALKAHGIACEAARAHGGIVAPPDYWHIHELSGYAVWADRSVGQVERSWLTAMPPWMHFKNICYHIRTADMLGFHAAILLTGHYGPNWEDLKTLLDLVQPHVGTRLYGLPDFEANQPGFDEDGRRTGDHAGKVETSLLWALHPECVDLSRVPPPDEEGPHFAMGRNARESNRRVGERMVPMKSGGSAPRHRSYSPPTTVSDHSTGSAPLRTWKCSGRRSCVRNSSISRPCNSSGKIRPRCRRARFGTPTHMYRIADSSCTYIAS